MASLDPCSLGGVCIYKRSFSSKSMVVVELAKARPVSEEYTESFEKAQTEEKVLRNVSNDGALKMSIRQSLSGTCNTRTRTARNVLFQLVGQRRQVSGLSL